MKQSAKRKASTQNSSPAMTAHLDMPGPLAAGQACVYETDAIRGQLASLTRAVEALTIRFDQLTAEMRSIRRDVLKSIEDLCATTGTVMAEVRSMRRDRQTGSAIVIENLCKAIHAAYGSKPFTAARLFEDADAPGNGSLGEAIEQACSRKPGVRKLAHLLKRSIGPWGQWIIRLQSEGERDGNHYVIAQHPRY